MSGDCGVKAVPTQMRFVRASLYVFIREIGSQDRGKSYHGTKNHNIVVEIKAESHPPSSAVYDEKACEDRADRKIEVVQEDPGNAFRF